MQQGRPGGHQGAVEFDGAVETAKGDKAVGQSGQGTDGRSLQVGHERCQCGQSDDFFGELVVQLARRQHKGVGQVVVHGGQPGRAGVAQPAELQRRGFVRKGHQPVVAGVA